MPMFLRDQRERIELTDEQVELARMALDDCKQLGAPSSAAILLHRKEFSFTLKHALCAVTYAQQHPETTAP